MEKLNVMIVGVGGQGTLLASRIIGNVAMKKGYDVKMSEVHGMAQRGGSVVTYLKLADKVYSPIIEKSDADIILGFEELESLRWIDYLKKDGKIIINTQKIDPMPVIIGKRKYPEGIVDKIKDNYRDVAVIDALKMAKKAGNIKAVNTVIIGQFAKAGNIEKEIWIEAIKETVPRKFLDVNLNAFEAGYSYTMA